MKCDVATDLITDSLMDELSETAAEELRQHLASCATCAEEESSMRDIWGSMGQLSGVQANPAAPVEFGRRLERRHRAGSWTTARIAASIIFLLATGAVLGRFVPGGQGRGGAAPDSPQFMLLIRGDEPARILPEAQLTQEYAGWAEQLAAAGTLVAADKLVDDEGQWLNDASQPREALLRSPVGGYFLIRAAGYEEAVDIARESPHVRYGGTIEVRAIERAP